MRSGLVDKIEILIVPIREGKSIELALSVMETKKDISPNRLLSEGFNWSIPLMV